MGILNGRFYFGSGKGNRFKDYKLNTLCSFFENSKDKLSPNDHVDALQLLDSFKIPFKKENDNLPLSELTALLIDLRNDFNKSYLFLKLVLNKEKEINILLTINNNFLDVIIGLSIEEYDNPDIVLTNKLRFIFSTLSNLIKAVPNNLRMTDKIPNDAALYESIFFNQLSNKPRLH